MVAHPRALRKELIEIHNRRHHRRATSSVPAPGRQQRKQSRCVSCPHGMPCTGRVKIAPYCNSGGSRPYVSAKEFLLLHQVQTATAVLSEQEQASWARGHGAPSTWALHLQRDALHGSYIMMSMQEGLTLDVWERVINIGRLDLREWAGLSATCRSMRALQPRRISCGEPPSVSQLAAAARH